MVSYRESQEAVVHMNGVRIFFFVLHEDFPVWLKEM